MILKLKIFLDSKLISFKTVQFENFQAKRSTKGLALSLISRLVHDYIFHTKFKDCLEKIKSL